MAEIKSELIVLLNQALELEHASRIQYLAHAEQIKGIDAEPIIARLKEIAGDEGKHEGIFRDLVGNYLDGIPSMGMAKTHEAKETMKILKINLAGEKEAVDFYKTIYKKVTENKEKLTYIYETLEHQIRHVIIEEQQHIAELTVLIGG
jgi:bacterioferritin (cytochrome b1)